MALSGRLDSCVGRFVAVLGHGGVMRSRRLAAIPLLIGIGLACSDSTGVTETDLVGTWSATAFKFSDFGDPVMDFDVIGMGGSVTASFVADGTYQIVMTAIGTETGTWSLQGSDVLLLATGADTTRLDVSLSGTTLTISSNDLTFDFGAGEIPAQLHATFVRQ
jgi:hypothetical protein